MPSFILTDSTVPKESKTHISIKTLTIPEKGVVLYRDKHPEAPRGLILKVTTSGKKTWLLRYQFEGKQRRLTLGHYPAWKPARARKEAKDVRAGITGNNPKDPIAEREARAQAELEARQSQRQARREAEEAERKKVQLTLGKLLKAYVENLKRKGKTSVRAVENCVKKNVETTFPDLWDKPAEEINLDECFDIVAALVDAGKLREAAKLRSYIRAAYTAAIKARTDATIGPELRKFKLSMNPAADLATIEGNIKPRDRVLSLLELRLYWKRISALPSPDSAVLRFHMLTGGQRLVQIFRLTDKDRGEDSITLFDPKGRRQIPRVHVVPLIEEAVNALDDIGSGPFLVSFDGGASPATDSAFRNRFREVCNAMLKDKEIKERFTPGDLRRTVETQLTAAGVSSDSLKHLMSHGFGGVQDRHYQRYEYQAEKLAALNTLYGLLVAPPGDVVPMKRKTKK